MISKEIIIGIIDQYFSGEISRNDLMLKARDIKQPEVLCYDDYCSYDFLVLNGIIRILAEIPELSYNDDELKDIFGILQNKRRIRNNYLFKIPEMVLGKNDFRLIEIVEDFIDNYKNGKIIRDFDANSLKSYVSKDELEFLCQFYNELSKNEKETIVKTMEMDIFAILNRFGGLWESIKSCFISANDISREFLLEIIERQLDIMRGKHPVFICLTGTLENLSVSLF